MKILAVTACTSGVAHTYIAAESILQACEKAGIECKVETQGVMGIENAITEEDVITADAVILTTDMPIKNDERFDNLKKINIRISSAVKQADDIVAKTISMLNA